MVLTGCSYKPTAGRVVLDRIKDRRREKRLNTKPVKTAKLETEIFLEDLPRKRYRRKVIRVLEDGTRSISYRN